MRGNFFKSAFDENITAINFKNVIFIIRYISLMKISQSQYII